MKWLSHRAAAFHSQVPVQFPVRYHARVWGLAFLVLFLAVLDITCAMAQVAVPPAAGTPIILQTSPTIDYGQAFGFLQPYVIALASSLFAAILAWISYLLQKYTGIKIDQSQADVYLRAAKNQAASLIADGFVKIEQNGKVTVSNAALAGAANEMLKAIPDAAAHFNVTPEAAAKKIVDMVPQVPAAAPVVVAAVTTPATPVAPSPRGVS